jgi:hypothetical protein
MSNRAGQPIDELIIFTLEQCVAIYDAWLVRRVLRTLCQSLLL